MIKPGGGCEETMWKSATVNHTRLTACFPRQLCKLKWNMNKYRARTCMYVHESCLHTLKMLNQRKKTKQNGKNGKKQSKSRKNYKHLSDTNWCRPRPVSASCLPATPPSPPLRHLTVVAKLSPWTPSLCLRQSRHIRWNKLQLRLRWAIKKERERERKKSPNPNSEIRKSLSGCELLLLLPRLMWGITASVYFNKLFVLCAKDRELKVFPGSATANYSLFPPYSPSVMPRQVLLVGNRCLCSLKCSQPE